MWLCLFKSLFEFKQHTKSAQVHKYHVGMSGRVSYNPIKYTNASGLCWWPQLAVSIPRGAQWRLKLERDFTVQVNSVGSTKTTNPSLWADRREGLSAEPIKTLTHDTQVFQQHVQNCNHRVWRIPMCNMHYLLVFHTLFVRFLCTYTVQYNGSCLNPFKHKKGF